MWNQGGTKGGTKAFAMDFREFMVAARGLIILLFKEPDAQTWACLDVPSRILRGGVFDTTFSFLLEREGGTRFRYLTVQWDT